MVLILIRCVYRVVENTGNTSVNLKNPQELKTLSPLERYEWYFYVFESATMLANSLLWNIWHPGRYLPENNKIFLAEDGQTEMIIDEDEADVQPAPARAVSTCMQLLTFGLWGEMFSKKRKAVPEHMDSSGDFYV
jgi:hypothetical protein